MNRILFWLLLAKILFHTINSSKHSINNIHMLGDSINEKFRDEKLSDSDKGMSTLFHTIFGLDHYPNYLYRFKPNIILELESTLIKALEKFQLQKKEVLEFENIRSEFLQRNFDTDMSMKCWLSKPLFEALGSPNMKINEYSNIKVTPSIQLAIVDNMETIENELFLTEILNPNACKMIIDRSKLFSEFLQEKLARKNALFDDTSSSLIKFCNRPPPLYYMGLQDLEEFFIWFINIISPISFPEYVKDGKLDWAQGYIVGYSPSKISESDSSPSLLLQRSALINHTDDSEITVNIALSNSYEGGELDFCGRRATENEDVLLTEFKKPHHILGNAIIHSGRQLHRVNPVTSGERYQLIFWLRSSKGLRRKVCPCCWMNNRELPNDCICSDFWN